MTKRLLLLRHAQSDFRFKGNDKQRPLTGQGVSEASALGCYIRDNDLSPDYILCSDAKRTRETLGQITQCLYKEINPGKIAFLPGLYNGGVDDYLAELRNCDNNVNTLMLIGHHPRIPSLARMLANENTCDESIMSMLNNYMPATMTIFNCEIDNWEDLRYGNNSLIDILDPNDYICHIGSEF